MAKRANYQAGEIVATEIFRTDELRKLRVSAGLRKKILSLPDGMSPAKMAAYLGCPTDYVKAVLLQSMRAGA